MTFHLPRVTKGTGPGPLADPRAWQRSRRVTGGVWFDEFIRYFNQGGLIYPALVKQSMTLFAQEVMPHFR